MYKFYLGNILLPIAPDSIQTSINNANKTFTLIDGNEINLLKTAKLTDFEFECLLPNQRYPFAVYSGGYKAAAVFLDQFEKLKAEKKPFQFIVNRVKQNGSISFATNAKVSLESYTIVESAKNLGTDVSVKIKLKQYREWETKIYNVSNNTATANSARGASANSPEPTGSAVESYNIKSGDTLWAIAKKYYGDGSLCYKLADYNGISNPNLIYAGNNLNIPAVSELR